MTRLQDKVVKFLEEKKQFLNIKKNYSPTISSVETSNEFLKNSSLTNYSLLSNGDSNSFICDGLALEEKFDELSQMKFITVLKSIIPQIEKIPDEEKLINQCKLTGNSFINDICDPFLPNLIECGITAFLKNITVVGIPITHEKSFYSVSSSESEWKLKTSLSEKFFEQKLLSHAVLDSELKFSLSENSNNGRGVFSGSGKKYHGVVPLFTPKVAAILKPLMQTEIFGIICSYCIYKNIRSKYRYAHFTGLLSIWCQFLKPDSESDFVQMFSKLICGTAAVYLDLFDFKMYKLNLIHTPRWGLGEERGKVFKIPSENLVKPLFFSLFLS